METAGLEDIFEATGVAVEQQELHKEYRVIGGPI
jgi:hypothetical protein